MWNKFKVNNKNTKRKSSGVFIVNFEHISLFSSVNIIDVEQANKCWVKKYYKDLNEALITF